MASKKTASKKTAKELRVKGRIALIDREAAAELAEKIGGTEPLEGHIAWGYAGGKPHEYFLKICGDTPTVFKHRLGTEASDAEAIATGRNRAREIIRQLTGKTPSEIKLSFPRGNDPEDAAVQTPAAAPAAATVLEAKPQRAKDTGRGPSALDLAATFLVASGEPHKLKDITDAVLAAGWKTNGKTPAATLNAAIIREIAAKGEASRFRKADRGLFTAGAA